MESNYKYSYKVIKLTVNKHVLNIKRSMNFEAAWNMNTAMNFQYICVVLDTLVAGLLPTLRISCNADRRHKNSCIKLSWLVFSPISDITGLNSVEKVFTLSQIVFAVS